MLEYCKLQIGCMLVIAYIAFVYCEERRRFKQHNRFSLFDMMLSLCMLTVLFDGATAYTVNHLDSVNSTVNMVLHLLFLLGLDSFIFCLFLYMVSITTGLPKSRPRKVLLYSPFVINVILVIIYIPELKYYEGAISNYSMGMSAYTCFIMAGVYIVLSLATFFGRWRYIEKHNARIMAIADVFDALSEKRCYKEAMPLDKCFEIIQEGSGQDFDPVLVEVFLDIRPQVELAYQTINSKEQSTLAEKNEK